MRDTGLPSKSACRLSTLVVTALLIAACATTPRADVPIEQRALATIQQVDALYLSTLSAVGELHRAHKLSDDNYARVLDVAESVRVAREAAAQALLVYLGGVTVIAPSEEALRAKLDLALARLNAASLTLKAEAPTQ